MNQTLTFRTDLASPRGLQRIKDCLQRLGIRQWSVNFIALKPLLVVSVADVTPDHIANALHRVGIWCELVN